MYLYIGNDVVINTKDIVGIFDSDNTTVSKATRKFLNLSEKKGSIINAAADIPKSFVVCRDKSKDKNVTYLCQLSPATLQKRRDMSNQS